MFSVSYFALQLYFPAKKTNTSFIPKQKQNFSENDHEKRRYMKKRIGTHKIKTRKDPNYY